MPSGSPGLRQSASALLAVRSSRPPPPASVRLPESKMARSRQRGLQTGARPLFCALLLSLFRFVGGDGVGGDPAAAGSTGSSAAQPHRRFEYKYSFKGPHLVQSDGTVPFWAYAGSKPGQRAGGSGPFPALRLFFFTFSPLHIVRAVEGTLLSSPSCRPTLVRKVPSISPQVFLTFSPPTFLLSSLL